jgi:putative Mg2+ transporter-C (MgtC) family protein
MQIWQTIVAEFSDIPTLADLTRITLRLVAAGALGGLLGYERERRGKAAGLRTHMLVSIGAALFVLISLQGGTHADSDAMSRVMQGVVAGIGFLGAGAIIKSSNRESPSGLTTAAGIWFTAAIGVAAGMGHIALAMLSTLLALIILALLPKVLSATTDEKIG